MPFITHRLQAYFLQITSGRWPLFTSMHCCKRVWKLQYTRLRRSSSIVATSSTMACLSSWIVMIRLRNTRSFRNPPQEKIWYSKLGRPSRPSDVAETRDNSSEHCCTFQRSITTDHTKWRPLLYHSPSRQPQQAIAPAQYSNLKCVSRLRATRYILQCIRHIFITHNSNLMHLRTAVYIFMFLWPCIIA